MDTGLAGKAVIVTGSTANIGKAIALAFAEEGCRVVVVGRDEAAGWRVVDEARRRGAPEFDVFGFVRERTGNVMPGITPSNTYTTRDGKNLIVAANGDAIFVRLMRIIGRQDLADDASLADNAGRDARARELYAVIGAWVAANDEATVLKLAAEAEVPASRIFSAADMFADPQYLAREMLLSTRLPDGKSVRVPGIVPKLSATPGEMTWAGPKLGEHTNLVLERLGYPQIEIDRLRRAKAI